MNKYNRCKTSAARVFCHIQLIHCGVDVVRSGKSCVFTKLLRAVVRCRFIIQHRTLHRYTAPPFASLNFKFIIAR